MKERLGRAAMHLKRLCADTLTCQKKLSAARRAHLARIESCEEMWLSERYESMESRSAEALRDSVVDGVKVGSDGSGATAVSAATLTCPGAEEETMTVQVRHVCIVCHAVILLLAKFYVCR